MTTGKTHNDRQQLNDRIRPQPFFQARLTVGPTDDGYEKEADAVAEQVMRMPASPGSFFTPKSLSIKPLVQSKCTTCAEEKKTAQSKPVNSIVQREDEEETTTSEPAAAGGSTIDFTPPLQSTTVPDFLGLRQPFLNRGIFHLWEPNSALQVWNYNFNFFQRMGLAADTATTFSNFTAPFFIDSQLKAGNPTWWEITDRELNTTTFNASLPILDFNADFSPVAPAWFRTIFQSGGGGSGVQRKCAACEDEECAQRKENGNTDAPDIVGHAIQSGGSPMDNDTQSFMETRFGYDFGQVKIHNDSLAASSAQSINALAYTSGNDVVFNQGQYSPGTSTGKKLLAHELTHVVQQNSSIMS
jgi:hypothetical protein